MTCMDAFEYIAKTEGTICAIRVYMRLHMQSKITRYLIASGRRMCSDCKKSMNRI